jgi:hypothetical protein
MASPQSPIAVKLIVAVLYSDESRLFEGRERMVEQFGPIDFASPPFSFEVTNYYVPEMGAPIFRIFYAFTHLVSPGDLARIKLATNKIEDSLTIDRQRRVNLDPGYLDHDKFVLASAKYNGQKVYLAEGIWADLTLHYEKGRFSAYPWSFPDFRSGAYEKTFLQIREIYKGQLKLARALP